MFSDSSLYELYRDDDVTRKEYISKVRVERRREKKRRTEK